ncbi:MAG: hypothetical protein CMQ05_02070 [Gammaproteobacteria bacterium]|uniref:Uncharacterized protein n=1 Tax=OM182 bacterium MED-G24 TaxID=1986255 RepID=A0A2A5WYX9_9GAMM|nr:hypothetical protein [Gammaproteobacteria bacterium]PDH41672.1 MAG: hypothetical protein CNE99_01210 [OM182 bacterium MED-G24]
MLAIVKQTSLSGRLRTLLCSLTSQTQSPDRIPTEKVETSFYEGKRRHLTELVSACRPHQLEKNALIFVPLLTAHLFTEMNSLISSVLASLAFGLCASSVYLLTIS